MNQSIHRNIGQNKCRVVDGNRDAGFHNRSPDAGCHRGAEPPTDCATPETPKYKAYSRKTGRDRSERTESECPYEAVDPYKAVNPYESERTKSECPTNLKPMKRLKRIAKEERIAKGQKGIAKGHPRRYPDDRQINDNQNNDNEMNGPMHYLGREVMVVNGHFIVPSIPSEVRTVEEVA